MADIDEKALAEALTSQGIVDSVTLDQARRLQEEQGIGLVQALLALGAITPQDVATAVEAMSQRQTSPPSVADAASEPALEPASAEEPAPAPETGSEDTAARPARPRAGRAGRRRSRASLDSYEVSPEAVAAVPRALAEEYTLLPLQISEERILIATADATNVFALDAVRDYTHRRVEAIEVDEEELKKAIDQYYAAMARERIQLAAGAKDLTASVQQQEVPTGIDVELLQMLDQAPVVQVVSQLVTDAVRMNASDIHVEPRSDHVQVRFRVDGRLMTYAQLPKSMQQGVISRIKILADEDIAETRMPQDGRFATEVDDRAIDLRVSTLPTYWGEKAVLRILDKSRVFVSLGQLGFRPDMQEQYERLVQMRQGMVLVTGPTGSGKSTTLYATLHTINDEAKNITTVEDPIEYEIHGVNHTQVNTAIELTFARALRHILRQDPDIILVGEIRDRETAEMAFRAALTGHLVLSTLHTNDAPSAPTRLVDMGIEPYIIASSLTGVLAQRLVRRLCPRCREQVEPSQEELDRLGLTPEQAQKIRFHRGRGCQYCRNTGYSGRVAVYELMVVNEEVREGIVEGLDASELRKIALRSGMKSLKHDGLLKVHQGITSAAEICAVMFAGEV